MKITDIDRRSCEAIDVASFEERLGPGTADLLLQLVEMFLQEAKNKIPQLSKAVDREDFDMTYEIAHRLVGSSSSAPELHPLPRLRIVCRKWL